MVIKLPNKNKIPVVLARLGNNIDQTYQVYYFERSIYLRLKLKKTKLKKRISEMIGNQYPILMYRDLKTACQKNIKIIVER